MREANYAGRTAFISTSVRPWACRNRSIGFCPHGLGRGEFQRSFTVTPGRGRNGSANFHRDIVQQILSTGNRCGMKNACLSLADTPTYRIREVDGQDDEIADMLADLHRLTFFNGACLPDFDWGHWWVAYHETQS